MATGSTGRHQLKLRLLKDLRARADSAVKSASVQAIRAEAEALT